LQLNLRIAPVRGEESRLSAPVPLHPSTPAGLDLNAIQQRQQSSWASSDFAAIGTTLQIVGESLAEAADVRAGERVVDVAAGNGNASLAAARRHARVTSTDYVPHQLQKAAARASAEGLEISCEVADAESLPFADGAFDVALSTFGVMFAVQHVRAAQELLRITRRGGRIGLANWTPEGLQGEICGVIAGFVAPPPGLRSPLLWGSEPYIVKLFGPQASDLRCVRRHFNFRYRSAAHWLEVFRTCDAPTCEAFAALDGPSQRQLGAAITALLERWNIAGSDSLVVPAQYLETVITRA
jgi:SAM-dependent methyltransferase